MLNFALDEQWRQRIQIFHSVSNLQLVENPISHFIRREHVTRERQLAIVAGQLDEVAPGVQRSARSTNLIVQAMESFEFASKLFRELSNVGCGVTFFQDRADNPGIGGLLEIELGEKKIEFVWAVGIKLQDLMLEHQDRQPPDLPRHARLLYNVEKLLTEIAVVVFMLQQRIEQAIGMGCIVKLGCQKIVQVGGRTNAR